jgi:dUTP pyrophosphatase
MIHVPLKKLNDRAATPRYGTAEAAGVDLQAESGFTLAPGETKLVKTSIAIAIPNGYVGLLCSRSGLAVKRSVFVLNSPGIIDADYRGELGVVLHNAGDQHQSFDAGDRIAQLVLVPYAKAAFATVNELPATQRGEGGFGSTGVAA